MTLLLQTCLLLACDGAGSSGSVDATTVASLRIDPTELSLVTQAGAPATATFTAWATFDDGHEEALALVSWDSSSTSAGTVDASGVFASTDTNGGITTITASHAGIEATAQVTVVYSASFVEDDLDAGIVDAFEGASAADEDGLVIQYPADGVNVPRNLNGLGFQWVQPVGDVVVSRLHFRSDLTDVSVYVDGNSWTATADLWSIISAANTHGSVEVQVEAGAWDGTTLRSVLRGPAIDITVNRFDARGSVLFWDSSQQAIMRIPFGETTPTRFWPVARDGTCIGCHSLAEGREKMVVTHDGIGGTFSVVDVADVEAPRAIITPADNRRMTFKTISPDGTRMLGVLHGDLVLYNLDTGLQLSTLDSAGYSVTHPDWSPDGDRIVMVRQTGSVFSDMGFEGGEIVQVSWDGSALGQPQVLVARSATHNSYYPTYSPDGAWIAYNRSSGDSYADEDAEIWMVNVEGTIDLPLGAANGEPNGQNSYPRWAPLPDDNVLWLAFSSDRGYPLSSTEQPQIWVSAIDTTLAAAGADPSRAPFWLPGQTTSADNHLPVWWDN